MKTESPSSTFPPVAATEVGLVADFARRIWPRVYGELISDAQISYMIGRMYAPATVTEEVESGGIRYHWIEREGQRIGYLAFGPVAPNTPCTLHKLYLVPEFHGLGIGSEALRWVMKELKSSGVPELNLRVNRGNRAAIRCYERCGFRRIGEDCLDIGGGFVMDDYLMNRTIDA